MADFLVGAELSKALQSIIGGKNLRCAVAFWGKGSHSFFESMGARPQDWRVVCNIDLGGTSPDALIELGAPENNRLRHKSGLHTKVYISDQGVIIGSANASDNGIGFDSEGAKLIEAATFHEPNTPVWQATANWFEKVFESSHKVDEAAVELARARFVKSRNSMVSEVSRPGSLLDMICLKPEEFGDLSFVVSRIASDEEDISNARQKAKKIRPDEKEEIDAMPKNGVFTNWQARDVLRWRPIFLEFWIPRNSLRIYPRIVRMLDHKEGWVFSVQDTRSVRSMLPTDAPSFTDAQRIDAELVRRLRDRGRYFYPNAHDLAKAISELRENRL
ncbi:phospholipase D family protein [Roseomonas sp. OT10]|uniref:phospholipase D family protein n=1 Tax=Roseomonas cutis TaxID=2897332 RepID=UPI001E3B90E9|nr:phospholipase D family protein [Roseomonas sp. OT10]UFN47759.1 phospholipase D family protein [Roseomonas sp. OT10]